MRSARAVASVAVLLAGASQADGLAQELPLTSLPAAIAAYGDEYTRILSVRALPDGRVLVSDVVALWVVDAPGAVPREIGPRGRGPREYQRAGWLHAAGGDTTWLEDLQDRRRHVVVGATLSDRSEHPPRRAIDFQLLGISGDGTFAELQVTRVANGPDERRLPPLLQFAESTAVLRYDRQGRVDTIARLRGDYLGETTVAKATRSGRMVYQLRSPLEGREQAAFFADGWLAVLRRDPYRVDWVTPAGRLLVGRALPYASVRVDERQRRRAIANHHFAGDSSLFESGDFPRWPNQLPPFLNDALTPLADGSVLVRRAPDARQAGLVHDVVGRDGSLRSRLLLAATQRVVASDPRGIYVATRDADGVETLTLHAVGSR
jgi:hypothetical protein